MGSVGNGLRQGQLLNEANFDEVSSPVTDFPTRMVVVDGDIWSAKALAGRALAFNQLSLHVPVPLVDLTGLQTESFLQLSYFSLVPLRALLEFSEQNFILVRVFPDPLLCFFGALGSVSDDNAGHKGARSHGT